MEKMKGRVLGIDYGTKRMGVAVSDPMRIIAQSLTTVEYKQMEQAITQLRSIILDYDVREVVVGLPLTLKGKTSAVAKKSEQLCEQLSKIKGIELTLMDERFTSRIAENTMRQAGQSPSLSKGTVDKIAATVLLQDYLDKSASR